jgi:hypothetical protein
MHNHRGALAYKYDSQDSYACNAYSQYPPKCSMHYVKSSALRSLALDAIKRVSGFVRGNEEEFARMAREASELQSAEAAKARREQLAKTQKRYAELDSLIKKLYEDKVTGTLSPKRFEMLSHEYESEQEDTERQIAALKADLDHFDEDSGKADKFIGIVRRYTDFTELTPAMLNEFVEKILVHEAVGVGYRRTQKVEIFLNFIGKFDVPGYEEPEPEPFDPVEHQRTKWRANYYKYRDKIMAAKAEKAAGEKAARVAAMPVKTPEEVEAEKEAKRQRKLEYHRNYQREWQRGRKEKEKIDKIAHEKVI